MRKTFYFLAGACLALVTACSAPTVLSSTPEMIVIGNIKSKGSLKAYQIAVTHCQSYFKKASLAPGDPPDGQVIYLCVVP